MLIKLKPDWSNWHTYQDATYAYLRSKGLGGHLMFNTEIPRMGSSDTPQRQIYLQYLTDEGIAVLLLLETLPTSIYEKIAGDKRFHRKWVLLGRLYEAQTTAVPAKEVGVRAGVVVTSSKLSGGLDGAQDNVGVSGDGDGDGDGAGESFTEEQSVIMDQLKRFKFTQHGDQALFTHLTMLKVLREALVNRDIVISDVEFLEYMAGSFGDESTYGDYVKAVVGRMRKAEMEVEIGGGATHRSEVGEVFEMLLELEKLSRAKVVAA